MSRKGIQYLFSFSTIFVGLLVCVALFSTTYFCFGFLIYPRFIVALAGIVVAFSKIRPCKLIPFCLSVCFLLLLPLLVSIGQDQWSHLLLFEGLVIRGVVLPALVVVFLLNLIDIFIWTRECQFRNLVIHKIFFVALGFQAVMVTLHLSVPSFQTYYLSCVNLDNTWRQIVELGLPRFSGVGGLSIYDTSLVYPLIAAIAVFDRQVVRIGAWLSSLVLALATCLCILHGRTGLFFVTGLVVLIAYFEFQKAWLGRLLIPRFLSLIVAFLCLFYSIIDSNYSRYVFESAFEVLINYFGGKGFRSDSTDDLLANHLAFPSVDVIFCGSGIWAQPDLAAAVAYPYSSDSGYLLLLNFGGAFFCLMFLIHYVACVIFFCRMVRNRCQYGCFKDTLLFWSFLMLVITVSSVKGPVFFSEHFMTAFFLLIGVYYKFVLPSQLMSRTISHGVRKI